MGRAEGPARARFWVCIGGGAALGMVVGLIQTARRPNYGSEFGIPAILIAGAAVGAGVGLIFWLKHLWLQ